MSMNQIGGERFSAIAASSNPWLKKVYQQQAGLEEEIPNGIWALIACELNNGAINTSVLLDFVELDFDDFPESAQNFDGIMGFTEWIAHFNPNTWGDWLMVRQLFGLYLRTNQNLPVLDATPDAWVDAVLRESRGWLIWTQQFIQIIRVISGVGITEAAKIYSGFLMRKPGWEKSLDSIYPPTNQTLLQIFEERTVDMQSLGSPDYILAEWLSSYFDRAAKKELGI